MYKVDNIVKPLKKILDKLDKVKEQIDHENGILVDSIKNLEDTIVSNNAEAKRANKIANSLRNIIG